jgi:hypothetical protein
MIGRSQLHFVGRIALLLSCLLVALAVQASPAGPAKRRHTPKHRARSNEPFSSFVKIDAKLTILNEQFTKLKANLSPESIPRPRSVTLNPDWKTMVREMQSTARSIQARSANVERHYRSERRQYGTRIFAALTRRAAAVRRQLRALNTAPGIASARAHTMKLDKAIVALVLQFQAVSGGYGAAHCDSGAWACCEPKQRQLGREAPTDLACKWVCVQQSNACTGFLGPRTRLPEMPRRSK